MINFWTERNQRNCSNKKSPLAFFSNLFKRKKYKCGGNTESSNPKVPTSLSVSVMDMRISPPCPISPALSTLTLTPGRTRDIDQDMEALRLSRQDNPFLQVLASRESLADSLLESESDDAILMSQEMLNESEFDPLSLPEIHEHMIRSPPPVTWPKSPNFRVFQFPLSQESINSSHAQDHHLYRNSKAVTGSSLDEQSKYLRHSCHEGNFGTYSTIHSTHSPRMSILKKPHHRSSSECRVDCWADVPRAIRDETFRNNRRRGVPKDHGTSAQQSTACNMNAGRESLREFIFENYSRQGGERSSQHLSHMRSLADVRGTLGGVPSTGPEQDTPPTRPLLS